MAEQAVTTHNPLDVPLPPVPEGQLFSDLQWKTLLSLADTVIPSISSSTPASKSLSTKPVPEMQLKEAISTLASHIHDPDAPKIAKQYLEENASTNPQFIGGLRRLFAEDTHEEGKRSIKVILNALNFKAGSLILTGSTTPIQDQSFEIREKIFRGWETSRIKPLRAFYRALIVIFKKTWIPESPTIRLVVGCPRVPIHGKPADGFEYEFLQFPPGNQPETIKTDVVIVGSGCGGSVAAKNLAEAGYRVLVVEKSYHYPSKYFPMNFTEGFVNMFEGGGAVISDNGSMAALAGSTWGGGGTINWAAALQTQGYVRREWASNGLPFFESYEYQQSLDRVCDRMGVTSEHTIHNYGNRVLLNGSQKLGYAAGPIPQNTGKTSHYCGYCMMGCHSTGKKGPTETFLADAARAGATFIEGFHADKILFKMINGRQVASGVQGTWTSRDSYLGTTGPERTRLEVIIDAAKVIISCGTLQSPLLLLRSGLKNPQIGRNLYLHPVILSSAIFNEEIRPWEGAALTTVVNEFENLDGQGHGVKIQNVAMLPAPYLSAFPWRDGFDYKLWAAKLPRMVGFLSLTRERDAGRVYPDPVDGRVRIDYTVSAYDQKHIIEALIATAKIAYIAGAREFYTTSCEIPPFIRPTDALDPNLPEGVNNAALQEWIANFQCKNQVNPERTQYTSAHQMGTCRMGTFPKMSVVGPDCQVWGTQGLYVMDASVFPSASGVNPMVTNMAIADLASRNVAKTFRE